MHVNLNDSLCLLSPTLDTRSGRSKFGTAAALIDDVSDACRRSVADEFNGRWKADSEGCFALVVPQVAGKCVRRHDGAGR